jgi:protein LTV1
MASAAARVTVARQRDESKEDKKARKQAVKDQKKTRRTEKKVTQERFLAEFKQQSHALSQREARRVHKL